MKTSFEIIEEKIEKYKHLDSFNALIVGYMDCLNQEGQDEVLLLDAFLNKCFQPYNDELFLKVLLALFENGIGAGNDMANETDFLKFPNKTFLIQMLHPYKKQSLSIGHSNKRKSYFLKMKKQIIERYYNLVLFFGVKMYLKQCNLQDKFLHSKTKTIGKFFTEADIVVIAKHGSAYITTDHYKTFTRIR